jgi:hypothetical protein
MIKWLFALASLLLFVSAAEAQVYGLEELNMAAGQHVASKDLQGFMEKAVSHDLQDCSSELQLDKTQRSTYFAAIAITLDVRKRQSFLVFPSQYCMAFFGAHAIAYWIVSKDSSKGYRLLYEGRSDGVELLQTFSHGKKDLRSAYGSTYIALKYNGNTYKRVGSGEFP